MDLAPLLSRPHLSLITRHADYELSRIQDLILHTVLVDGRGELEEVLGRLLVREEEAIRHPKTLDLIGHSAPGQSLLILGDWVIDANRSSVTAFFRELADNNVLPRLGVSSIRLLGCHTADSGHGRETICALSDILGLEVFGTNHLIYSAHYDENGFRDDCKHALVCASDLRRELEPRSRTVGEPYQRVLDIDSLPASPLSRQDSRWPRRIADGIVAQSIVRLIRRSAGAHMPGLLASPNCEIALPSSKPNWYYLAQILLDGEFVRVYPDGARAPGVVFPVEDPFALRNLVENLPLAPEQAAPH